MRILGLHHVAFAHGEDSAAVQGLVHCLGLEVEHMEEGEGFIERMFPVAGGTYIQTLESTGPGIVERFVERRGSSLHHVAFEVDSIEDAVKELQARGVSLVDEQPQPGGMGTRVVFAQPASFGGLLIELVESPEGDDGLS